MIMVKSLIEFYLNEWESFDVMIGIKIVEEKIVIQSLEAFFVFLMRPAHLRKNTSVIRTLKTSGRKVEV